MRSTADFDRYEEGWYLVLSELEKVWEKTKAAGTKLNTRFPPWFGEKKAERSQDPLLRFLYQARDADHHGIEQVESVKYDPPSVGYYVPGGGPQEVYIEHAIIGYDGLVSYRGDKPLARRENPGKIKLQRVVNRGNEFDPPNEHLGQPLRYTDPVFVAHTGIKWYEQLVREAETKVAT